MGSGCVATRLSRRTGSIFTGSTGSAGSTGSQVPKVYTPGSENRHPQVPKIGTPRFQKFNPPKNKKCILKSFYAGRKKKAWKVQLFMSMKHSADIKKGLGKGMED